MNYSRHNQVLTKANVWVDEGIKDVVDELNNNPKIHTCESCEGFFLDDETMKDASVGKHEAYVFFRIGKDGPLMRLSFRKEDRLGVIKAFRELFYA